MHISQKKTASGGLPGGPSPGELARLVPATDAGPLINALVPTSISDKPTVKHLHIPSQGYVAYVGVVYSG